MGDAGGGYPLRRKVNFAVTEVFQKSHDAASCRKTGLLRAVVMS
jgi:hypothetical protein